MNPMMKFILHPIGGIPLFSTKSLTHRLDVDIRSTIGLPHSGSTNSVCLVGHNIRAWNWSPILHAPQQHVRAPLSNLEPNPSVLLWIWLASLTPSYRSWEKEKSDSARRDEKWRVTELDGGVGSVASPVCPPPSLVSPKSCYDQTTTGSTPSRV